MPFKSLFVYPKYPDNLTRLFQLAYNLWCSWNYDAINLFYRIDAKRFREVNHNPVQLLLGLPPERIDELSKDPGFLFELDKVWQAYQQYMSFRKVNHGDDPVVLDRDQTIAYFSMEFGLHECMPIYGGGLGLLAGDFLKAASDLCMPLVGVGLIYKFGYFTQRININGDQEEQFLEFDNHQIPMRILRDEEGRERRVRMQIAGHMLEIRLWLVQVGQIRLILLDTDLDENPADLRAITDELYVANREKRLQQELVLGLGGFKALKSLDIHPRIYHVNEGHSAFLVIARLQELMNERGFDFAQATALVRASTVFTTHTPVLAGNENFEVELVRTYLEADVQSLGLKFEEIARLGLVGNSTKLFWLPAFAIKFAHYINGVSRIHGEVSRSMWAQMFPQMPVMEVPIGHITNGVHSSWLSQTFTELLNRYIGPDFVHLTGQCDCWSQLNDIPDEQIWEAHRKNKQNLVTFIRGRLIDGLGQRGYIHSTSLKLGRLFNPEHLTIVFARRFAPYKRPTLILKNKERLKAILSDPARPVQLVFAGKAHPADTLGKDMIKEIIGFARENDLEDRVVFLENYDINVARHLAWGADVWLNNPIRPMEASGTSGMKAAINGVLNLSVPDGWWPEVYNGRNGWAITAGQIYEHSQLKETAEANQIYDLIEQEVTAFYYDRNEAGIPEKWVQMMKKSICSTYRFVNMNRVLIDYQNRFYAPSLRRSSQLAANDFQVLKDFSQQQSTLLAYWDSVQIVEFQTNMETRERLVESDSIEAMCKVNLGDIPESLLTVELYYRLGGQDYRIIPMTLQDRNGSVATYGGTFELQGYGTQGFNARVQPAHDIVRDQHPELMHWAF